MPPETPTTFCPEHTETMKMLGRFEATMQGLAAEIANLGNTIGKAFTRIDGHIDEGEKYGGSRDRLRTAEKEIEVIRASVGDRKKEIDILAGIRIAETEKLRKDMWRIGVTAGLVGGLIGHITPEFFELLTKFLKIHLGG